MLTPTPFLSSACAVTLEIALEPNRGMDDFHGYVATGPSVFHGISGFLPGRVPAGTPPAVQWYEHR